MPQHPVFMLELPDTRGKLLLTPCPGTQETTLTSALQELKAAGATAVVTLMTAPEMVAHDVENISAECAACGIDWFHLPVKDEEAPSGEFTALWEHVRTKIHDRLNNDEAVVVHCKGGSGRTGVVAAQIMLERGAQLPQTMDAIKSLRPKAFSHDVQVAYVTKIAESV